MLGSERRERRLSRLRTDGVRTLENRTLAGGQPRPFPAALRLEALSSGGSPCKGSSQNRGPCRVYAGPQLLCPSGRIWGSLPEALEETCRAKERQVGPISAAGPSGLIAGAVVVLVLLVLVVAGIVVGVSKSTPGGICWTLILA